MSVLTLIRRIEFTIGVFVFVLFFCMSLAFFRICLGTFSSPSRGKVKSGLSLFFVEQYGFQFFAKVWPVMLNFWCRCQGKLFSFYFILALNALKFGLKNVTRFTKKLKIFMKHLLKQHHKILLKKNTRVFTSRS